MNIFLNRLAFIFLRVRRSGGKKTEWNVSVILFSILIALLAISQQSFADKHSETTQALATAPTEATPTVEILKRSPRDFGFVLGDIIHQRFLLTLPTGQSLNINTLPGPGRMNDWLDLREFRFTPIQPSTTTNNHPHRYELGFTYQLFRQLDTPADITIPSTTLLTENAAAVALPKWTLSYSTLLPVNTQQEIPLRSPTPPTTLATQIWLNRLYLALGGLLFCIFAGGVWLIYSRYSQHRNTAFTRAKHHLRRLQKQRNAEPEQALKLFQHALAESAGRTLFPDQLDSYFKQNPHYKTLAEATDRLLRQGHQARFAPSDKSHHRPQNPQQENAEQAPPSWPKVAEIVELCQAFSQKEQVAWKP